MLNDPYAAYAFGLICGLILGILVCIPAKRKSRYYYDVTKENSKD